MHDNPDGAVRVIKRAGSQQTAPETEIPEARDARDTEETPWTGREARRVPAYRSGVSAVRVTRLPKAAWEPDETRPARVRVRSREEVEAHHVEQWNDRVDRLEQQGIPDGNIDTPYFPVTAPLKIHEAAS